MIYFNKHIKLTFWRKILAKSKDTLNWGTVEEIHNISYKKHFKLIAL